MAHGWLFAGPRGIGKINLALTSARRLLEGSNRQLQSLRADQAAAAMAERHVPADHHPDLHWLFPESGPRTLTVDQIRAAINALFLTSHAGHGKGACAGNRRRDDGVRRQRLAENPGRAKYPDLSAADFPPAWTATCDDSQPVAVACRAVPARGRETVAWLRESDTGAGTVDWEMLVTLAQGAPVSCNCI